MIANKWYRFDMDKKLLARVGFESTEALNVDLLHTRRTFHTAIGADSFSSPLLAWSPNHFVVSLQKEKDTWVGSAKDL